MFAPAGALVRVSVALFVIFSAHTSIGAGAASASAAPTGRSCRAAGASLREHLETVTEAVIDGRVSAVPRAADRAASGWKVEGSTLGSPAEGDSLLASLAGAAHGGSPLEAARLAVELSVKSFSWCPGALAMTDHLLVLDLTGMAGWLRGQGVHIEWPGGFQAATDSVAFALAQRKHPVLAKRLKASVAAVTSAVEGPDSDVRPARRLLDLVDEIEMVLR